MTAANGAMHTPVNTSVAYGNQMGLVSNPTMSNQYAINGGQSYVMAGSAGTYTPSQVVIGNQGYSTAPSNFASADLSGFYGVGAAQSNQGNIYRSTVNNGVNPVNLSQNGAYGQQQGQQFGGQSIFDQQIPQIAHASNVAYGQNYGANSVNTMAYSGQTVNNVINGAVRANGYDQMAQNTTLPSAGAGGHFSAQNNINTGTGASSVQLTGYGNNVNAIGGTPMMVSNGYTTGVQYGQTTVAGSTPYHSGTVNVGVTPVGYQGTANLTYASGVGQATNYGAVNPDGTQLYQGSNTVSNMTVNNSGQGLQNTNAATLTNPFSKAQGTGLRLPDIRIGGGTGSQGENTLASINTEIKTEVEQNLYTKVSPMKLANDGSRPGTPMKVESLDSQGHVLKTSASLPGSYSSDPLLNFDKFKRGESVKLESRRRKGNSGKMSTGTNSPSSVSMCSVNLTEGDVNKAGKSAEPVGEQCELCLGYGSYVECVKCEAKFHQECHGIDDDDKSYQFICMDCHTKEQQKLRDAETGRYITTRSKTNSNKFKILENESRYALALPGLGDKSYEFNASTTWDPSEISPEEVDVYIKEVKKNWPKSFAYMEDLALEFLCDNSYNVKDCLEKIAPEGSEFGDYLNRWKRNRRRGKDIKRLIELEKMAVIIIR